MCRAGNGTDSTHPSPCAPEGLASTGAAGKGLVPASAGLLALPRCWHLHCHTAGAPLPAGMVSANPKALGPAEVSPQGGRVVVALPNQLLPGQRWVWMERCEPSSGPRAPAWKGWYSLEAAAHHCCGPGRHCAGLLPGLAGAGLVLLRYHRVVQGEVRQTQPGCCGGGGDSLSWPGGTAQPWGAPSPVWGGWELPGEQP